MKLLVLLFKKAPKWGLAAAIILGSLAIFLAWRLFPRSPSLNVATASEPPPTVSLDERLLHAGELILCGNALVDARTGVILTDKWFQGVISAVPRIRKVLPLERLVLCGDNNSLQAFDFNGNRLPPLSVEGKALLWSAFDVSGSRVMYSRGGNIWLGKVNWPVSSVNDSRRATDVGYVRDDVFRGEWFWTGDSLFLPIMGRTQRIDLTSGSVTPDRANVALITRGVNPTGTKSAFSLGFGKFVVVDFAKSEAKPYPIRAVFREFVWLDENRLLFLSDQKALSILDASTGATAGPYEAEHSILKFASLSPNGGNVLLGTKHGTAIFDCNRGVFTSVSLPMATGAWISDTAFVCSNGVPDTSVRGVWLVDADGKAILLSGHPVDSGGGGAGEPILAIKTGAVWVSGGDLWSFDSEGGAVRQLTQGVNFPASLQRLNP